MHYRFWYFLLLLMATSASANAGSYYLVSSLLRGNPQEAGLYQLTDLNNDGDALDSGENILWGRGLRAPGIVRKLGAAILAADASRGQLIRYEDLNGDGDALDLGESMIWSDGLGLSVGIDSTKDGKVMAADLASGKVFQLRDLNGDGDALDAGERQSYGSGIEQVVGLLIQEDTVFAVSNSPESVDRLTDVNGDGDALDAGEKISYAATGIMKPGILHYTSLFDRGDGSMLLSDIGTGKIFQIQDTNGDGDSLDLVEEFQYANSTYSRLSGPWDMAQYVRSANIKTEGTLVVENFSGEVSLLQDINGDGDALDLGEVAPWANGLSAPVGIVHVPEPGTLLLLLAQLLVSCSRSKLLN
jgi:hypothetical protein